MMIAQAINATLPYRECRAQPFAPVVSWSHFGEQPVTACGPSYTKRAPQNLSLGRCNAVLLVLIAHCGDPPVRFPPALRPRPPKTNTFRLHKWSGEITGLFSFEIAPASRDACQMSREPCAQFICARAPRTLRTHGALDESLITRVFTFHLAARRGGPHPGAGVHTGPGARTTVRLHYSGGTHRLNYWTPAAGHTNRTPGRRRGVEPPAACSPDGGRRRPVCGRHSRASIPLRLSTLRAIPGPPIADKFLSIRYRSMWDLKMPRTYLSAVQNPRGNTSALTALALDRIFGEEESGLIDGKVG
ncbi:hypothetical protein EVAR_39883_1 [Eumeta japonica]|uniref:Uncharacterized protein n=1 Tax=Eumeta variegata TaxID=151549 RepID=A0A4C1WU59_EUMVA|nr:hypothetical protein EVAR_39883_1 [Eumeta japonica]